MNLKDLDLHKLNPVAELIKILDSVSIKRRFYILTKHVIGYEEIVDDCLTITDNGVTFDKDKLNNYWFDFGNKTDTVDNYDESKYDFYDSFDSVKWNYEIDGIDEKFLSILAIVYDIRQKDYRCVEDFVRDIVLYKNDKELVDLVIPYLKSLEDELYNEILDDVEKERLEDIENNKPTAYTAYVIDCEWDMGHEGKVFTTQEMADDFIKEIDWSLVQMELKDVKEQGLVSIKPVDLYR